MPTMCAMFISSIYTVTGVLYLSYIFLACQVGCTSNCTSIFYISCHTQHLFIISVQCNDIYRTMEYL